MGKVDAKGRVTLPKDLRERLGLEAGTTVEIRQEDDRLVIEPERDPGDILDEMEGILADVREGGIERVPDSEIESDPIAEKHRELVRRKAEQ
jgi:AbrB family looped-hinge helix DNA binding protein